MGFGKSSKLVNRQPGGFVEAGDDDPNGLWHGLSRILVERDLYHEEGEDSPQILKLVLTTGHGVVKIEALAMAEATINR